MQFFRITRQRGSDLAKRGVSSCHQASAAISSLTRPCSAVDRVAWHLTWDFTWWQVLGSNQRRLSRRFYRPLAILA